MFFLGNSVMTKYLEHFYSSKSYGYNDCKKEIVCTTFYLLKSPHWGI